MSAAASAASDDDPRVAFGSSPPKGTVASPWGGPAAALEVGVAFGADSAHSRHFAAALRFPTMRGPAATHRLRRTGDNEVRKI
jgi:hypothetical protein